MSAASKPTCHLARVRCPVVQTTAHLVDHILPELPIRHWVVSFPYPLRFLFAARPVVLTQVPAMDYRTLP